MGTLVVIGKRSLVCLILMVLSAEARIQLLSPSSVPQHKGEVMHELKGRLMMPLRSEAGQHGDSNTYFVQLPPSQHYYSQSTSQVSHVPGQTHVRRLLPVNFASNGRPARVYHWNMPVLRRMMETQQLQARRHSPLRPAYKSAATPKPRRSHKKAGPKKADSPIYHIMGLDNKQNTNKVQQNYFKLH